MRANVQCSNVVLPINSHKTPEVPLLPVTLETQVLNCLGRGLTNPNPPGLPSGPAPQALPQPGTLLGSAHVQAAPSHVLPLPTFPACFPVAALQSHKLACQVSVTPVMPRAFVHVLSRWALPCFTIPEASPAPITLHHSFLILSTAASLHCGRNLPLAAPRLTLSSAGWQPASKGALAPPFPGGSLWEETPPGPPPQTSPALPLPLTGVNSRCKGPGADKPQQPVRSVLGPQQAPTAPRGAGRGPVPRRGDPAAATPRCRCAVGA